MTVLHLITGLGRGGAEGTLVRLVAASRRHRHVVVCLLPQGPLTPLAADLREAGAMVEFLDASPGSALLRLPRLVRILRQYRPDVVQSWLYHADLMGLLAVRLLRLTGQRIPLAWNLRCSDMDLARYRRTTRAVVRALALTSRLPEAIVSNSQAAVTHHRTIGYADREFTVIPNGFDTARFAPDPAARARLRAAWDLAPEAPLLGYAGRFDPMKDLPLLCQTIRAARDRLPTLSAVLCGTGLGPEDRPMQRLLEEHHLTGCTRLLGPRTDMPAVLASLDCLLLTSRSEGFPNVLGEAMACGVPCVTTDVGDARLLVGDSGQVRPHGNAAALAEAVAMVLQRSPEERLAASRQARAHICTRYSLAGMVEAYETLWDTMPR